MATSRTSLLAFFLLSSIVLPLQAGSGPIPANVIQDNSSGVDVHYQLPVDGPLPKTYRVTLAAVDPQDPSWIISTFAAGVPRTVTAENQGKFTEHWNGLDDNFMPVPPGTYALKGIYMPGEQWAIDGEYHTIIPKLRAAGGSWGESPDQDTQPRKVEGDPVGSPLRDIDVAKDGKGVVYFQYLENGKNYFLTDFTKPIGYDQIITGYNSGSFAGGNCACTDGTVKFIARADGQPWGHQNATRHNVYLPDGWVKALAAYPDPNLGHTVVFDAEAGKIKTTGKKRTEEDASDRVDEVRALDGGDASKLAAWKIDYPLGLAARNDKLFILHGTEGNYEVGVISLAKGWADQQPALLFKVPAGIKPFDIEVDSHGRVYLSDSDANHVYQFSSTGEKLRTYGKLDAQKGGTYDPESFMAPEKLATWTDDKGQDRLLVVEMAGPNRLSEWSGEDGSLIRQWVIPQTRANDGYAVDPKDPNKVYLPGQEDTLVRWNVNYKTGEWTPEAVWTNIGTPHDGAGDFQGKLVQGMASPRLVYHGNDRYLAYWRGYVLYHDEGDHWRACAGVLGVKGEDKKLQYYLWRDTNADGKVQDDEYLPYQTTPPKGVLRYFGETWFDDLSLVAIQQGSPDIWQLSPTDFDKNGTPSFDPNGWKKLLTDNTFAANTANTATALRGGNEVGKNFSSAWASIAKADNGDLYVSARSGPDLTANFGTQYKLSRYVPDGKGGYTQKWRVGRMAFQGNAAQGEVYGPIFVSPPVNGLVGVVDNSRAGFVLYTVDGLYVDTLFPDAHVIAREQMGAYWQPGEYFTGYDYINKDDGKIYMALGKVMPLIYEAVGWSTTENPVKPITTIDPSVTISAAQIASPSEMALQVRGGAAASRVARFYPAPGGGPALDGSMAGWEACDPVVYGPSKEQSVEARCFYDPDHLYIRWHARVGHEFALKPLDLAPHMFAHDRGNDTLGLYLQGDPNAAPGGAKAAGRPGDVRFLFGLFQQGPVVVGMYPTWAGAGGSPQTYSTPVGTVTFGNVGLVPGVKGGYTIDDDKQGFVLAVSIPRAAIPGNPVLNGWRTSGNFDANFGGVNRFWWSNADGSASRETFDEPTESKLFPGAWSPIQCMPIDKLPIHSWMMIGPFGFAEEKNLNVNPERPRVMKELTAAVYPPDTTRDMSATYEGDITQTKTATHHLKWKDAEVAVDLVDVAEVLGWKSYDDPGVTYMVTHIYTPVDAEVTLEMFHPHGHMMHSGQLNGVALPTVKNGDAVNFDETQPLALKAGWNELVIRRADIWGDQHFGAKLVADPSVLWKLKVSGPPPTNP